MQQMANPSSSWQLIVSLRSYAIALLMVAASVLVGTLMLARWGNSPVDLLFIPAVLGAAVISGRRAALLAAIASVLAFDYFFTVPYRSFAINSPSDVVTFIVLLVVALVTSHLTGSIRAQADIAEAHAARSATIAGLARNLISCSTQDEIAGVATSQLAAIFDCNTVMVGGQPTPQILASVPTECQLTPSDNAIAAIVLEMGEPAGHGTGLADPAEWQFHPIRTQKGVIAAMGLVRDDGTAPVYQDQFPLLQNLLDQVALALDRAQAGS
jgi:two-component system sensor histidine kinase KdpD